MASAVAQAAAMAYTTGRVEGDGCHTSMAAITPRLMVAPSSRSGRQPTLLRIRPKPMDERALQTPYRTSTRPTVWTP